jgi:hypothetical protein
MPKRKGGSAHHNVGADYIDEYLTEIGSLKLVETMLVGRVTNHFGSGRFQVTLYTNQMDMYADKQCVLCGRLRARFNRGSPTNKINSSSIVLVQNNGISGGREFEILGVFTPDHIKMLKGINKDLYEALTKIVGGGDDNNDAYELVDDAEIDEEEEINIDNI